MKDKNKVEAQEIFTTMQEIKATTVSLSDAGSVGASVAGSPENTNTKNIYYTVFPAKKFKRMSDDEAKKQSVPESYYVHDFSSETFRKGIVDTFKKTGLDVMIDYNHRSGGSFFSYPSREDGEAAGWITDLVDGGPSVGVIAKIEWTKRGEESVKEKAYKYFSPEFSVSHTDKNTGQEVKSPKLYAVSLTNRPFIENQNPVELSENAEIGGNKNVHTRKMVYLMCDHINGSESVRAHEAGLRSGDVKHNDVSKNNNAQHKKEKRNIVMSDQSVEENQELEQVAAAGGGDDSDKSKDMQQQGEETNSSAEAADGSDVQQQLADAKRELEQLRLEKKIADAALLASVEKQKESVVNDALRDGRVVPAMMSDIKDYAKACGSDVEKLRKFLSSLPVQTHTEAIGQNKDQQSQDAGGANAEMLSDEDKLAMMFGLESAKEMNRLSNWNTIGADGKFRDKQNREIKDVVLKTKN